MRAVVHEFGIVLSTVVTESYVPVGAPVLHVGMVVGLEDAVVLLGVSHVRLNPLEVGLVVFHVGCEQEVLWQCGVVEVHRLLDVGIVPDQPVLVLHALGGARVVDLVVDVAARHEEARLVQFEQFG